MSESALERVRKHMDNVSILNHAMDIEPSHKRKAILKNLSEKLLEDAKWCWTSARIPRVLSSISPIDFFRSFVHKNTPCIIDGLSVNSWKSPWSWPDLVEKSRKGFVRVNATPTGRGDAIVFDNMSGKKVFVKPEERVMEFNDFVKVLLSSERGESILYLSAQNDSLRDEFSHLIASGFAPPSLPFGDAVFGKKADAVNLWIGNEFATSCVHRDVSYENLYCVVKGTKVFHLLSPCAAPFTGEKPFQNAKYNFSSNEWKIVLEDGSTRWIELDVADVDNAKMLFPDFTHVVEMIQIIEVKEGEVLYLPAGWLHRVTQTEPTIAVNYWYDRDFNATWALCDAIEHLVENA